MPQVTANVPATTARLIHGMPTRFTTGPGSDAWLKNHTLSGSSPSIATANVAVAESQLAKTRSQLTRFEAVTDPRAISLEDLQFIHRVDTAEDVVRVIREAGLLPA